MNRKVFLKESIFIEKNKTIGSAVSSALDIFMLHLSGISQKGETELFARVVKEIRDNKMKKT